MANGKIRPSSFALHPDHANASHIRCVRSPRIVVIPPFRARLNDLLKRKHLSSYENHAWMARDSDAELGHLRYVDISSQATRKIGPQVRPRRGVSSISLLQFMRATQSQISSSCIQCREKSLIHSYSSKKKPLSNNVLAIASSVLRIRVSPPQAETELVRAKPGRGTSAESDPREVQDPRRLPTVGDRTRIWAESS